MTWLHFLIPLWVCIYSENGNKLVKIPLQDGNVSPILPIPNYKPADEFKSLSNNFNGCTCRKDRHIIYCEGPENCKEFPSIAIFKQTTSFYLVNTNIIKLEKNDFSNNPQLKRLIIKSNDALVRIAPGAFNGLANLSYLCLSENSRLGYLDNEAFKGLINLKTLKIVGNGFMSFTDFTWAMNTRTIGNLNNLIIGHMKLFQINNDDFASMKLSHLERLCIQDCHINYIQNKSLNYFKKLKALHLVQNYLRSTNIEQVLKEMNRSGINLNLLNLASSRFTEQPQGLLKYIGQTRIFRLDLSHNHFESINTFPSMPYLQRLDITDTTSVFKPNVFDNLNNLTYLKVNDNKFVDIPKAVLLPNLRYLFLNNCGKMPSLEAGHFREMKKLILLDLSGCSIPKLIGNPFAGLDLKWLSLKNIGLEVIENVFKVLKNLLYLDFTGNNFSGNKLNQSLFKGLKSLAILILDYCEISDLHRLTQSLTNLPNLKMLSLKHNKLDTLNQDLFLPLLSLQVLDVSHNKIYSWENCIFANSSKIRAFTASDNQIKTVTSAMFEDFIGLETLYLQNNPFSCNCDDIYSLRKETHQSVDVGKVFSLLSLHVLKCVAPEKLSHLTLLEYLCYVENSNDCTDYTKLTILLSLCLMSGILIICFVVIYHYRWHIRYWIFLMRKSLLRSGKAGQKRMSKNKTGCIYDAFVSYSKDDRSFVHNLVSTLEGMPSNFKLCVYERDFEIGCVISESVLESVAQSRKTLLVISESYIKSYWCRWEAQVVEHQRLFFENESGECRNDSIALIKLGKIKTKHIRSIMLRYLIETHIYLEWEDDFVKQEHFWQKLRDFLKAPD